MASGPICPSDLIADRTTLPSSPNALTSSGIASVPAAPRLEAAASRTATSRSRNARMTARRACGSSFTYWPKHETACHRVPEYVAVNWAKHALTSTASSLPATAVQGPSPITTAQTAVCHPAHIEPHHSSYDRLTERQLFVLLLGRVVGSENLGPTLGPVNLVAATRSVTVVLDVPRSVPGARSAGGAILS
jgi:hypothetical protein